MRRFNPVAWLRAHPFAADALLAVALAAVSIGGLFTDIPDDLVDDYGTVDAFAVLLAAAAHLPVAWRRRAPDLVLALTGSATVATELAGYWAPISGLGVLVALYSVAAHNGDRRSSLVSLTFTMMAITGIYLQLPGDFEVAGFISNVVLFATAWILGDNLQTRRAYVRSLEERAAEAEARRDAEARQAVRAERARIARELHDVIAHSVSVMVVQAGAARRVVDTDRDKAVAAIESIERTGRDSLNELRRLLGIIRQAEGSPSGREPQPGIEDIELLVRQTSAAGLPVELQVEGTPRPLPAGVDLSVYRIIQEALTNTRKHAGPATATVRLCFADDAVELVVTDDGRGADCDEVDGRKGGHGLVGMQERVALFHGQLRVGNRPGGGFQVRATLPLERVP